MNEMDKIVEVTERIPGGPFAEVIKCKICMETVFDLKGDRSQKNIDSEMLGLTYHMAIRHQITVKHHKCDDPSCLD